MRPSARTAVLVAAALAVAHAAPAITSLGPLRRRLLPTLAGVGAGGQVALTFDDGPDPASTPRFLQVLARHGVRATFFVLGRMLERAPGLGRDLVAAGHEVGVHGWDHRCLLLRPPRQTYDDLARAYDLVASVTGEPPCWYRPPYGLLTTSGVLAARRLGLRPVLWTCWGEDWTSRATATSVLATVRRDLTDRGTVLLHDSDCTSAAGSWRRTLDALPPLLRHCDRQGLHVVPLREHLPRAR